MDGVIHALKDKKSAKKYWKIKLSGDSRPILQCEIKVITMYIIKALLYKCQEFGWDRIIKFLFDLYDILSFLIQ